jgi:putative flippase GtrA
MRSLASLATRYVAAGALNSVAGLVVVFALDLAGVAPALANACGFAVGLAISFFLHRRLFGAERNWPETVRYVTAVALAFIGNQAVLHFALTLSAGKPLSSLVSQAAGIATYSLILFCLSRYWVFRRPAAALV